jgi:hypothetical protein
MKIPPQIMVLHCLEVISGEIGRSRKNEMRICIRYPIGTIGHLRETLFCVHITLGPH